jgi:hypothetical protein
MPEAFKLNRCGLLDAYVATGIPSSFAAWEIEGDFNARLTDSSLNSFVYFPVVFAISHLFVGFASLNKLVSIETG